MYNKKKADQLDTGLSVFMALPFDHTHQPSPWPSPYFRNGDDWHGRKRMWVNHSWPWPWHLGKRGGWMCQIVTGVTSDVGVPSTYLVANCCRRIFTKILLVLLKTWRSRTEDWYLFCRLWLRLQDQKQLDWAQVQVPYVDQIWWLLSNFYMSYPRLYKQTDNR